MIINDVEIKIVDGRVQSVVINGEEKAHTLRGINLYARHDELADVSLDFLVMPKAREGQPTDKYAK